MNDSKKIEILYVHVYVYVFTSDQPATTNQNSNPVRPLIAAQVNSITTYKVSITVILTIFFRKFKSENRYF